MTRPRAPKPRWPRERRWFDIRTHDRREPIGETRDRPTHPGDGVRAVLLALVVALDAVAFATLLRPRHGYTSTHRLLIVLAVGAGAAVGALIVAGAAAAFRRRPDRSLWSATTAVPTISIVLAAFVAAAVASQLVRAIRPAGSQSAPAAAARADFQRWQATVVPIVVTWMHAIREDSAFLHGLPSSPRNSAPAAGCQVGANVRASRALARRGLPPAAATAGPATTDQPATDCTGDRATSSANLRACARGGDARRRRSTTSRRPDPGADRPRKRRSAALTGDHGGVLVRREQAGRLALFRTALVRKNLDDSALPLRDARPRRHPISRHL